MDKLMNEYTDRLPKKILEDIQDYVDSADYPAEKLADIMGEQDKPHTEETQLLAMVNDLLYRLMDYQRNKEKWYDEEDIEQKTVMKLKEVVTGNACSF